MKLYKPSALSPCEPGHIVGNAALLTPHPLVWSTIFSAPLDQGLKQTASIFCHATLAVCGLILTAEALTESRNSPCGIISRQSGDGMYIPQSATVFLCHYHSTISKDPPWNGQWIWYGPQFHKDVTLVYHKDEQNLCLPSRAFTAVINTFYPEIIFNMWKKKAN